MASSSKAPSARSPGPLRTWPRLHAIVDVDVCRAHDWTPTAYAQALLDGGAVFLQLRAKRLPSRDFLALCDAVVSAAQPYGATIIVNDRVDLAALSGADGVHVGQEDLPVAGARRILGDDAIVGWSTHSRAQIAAALATSASYVAVGPIFGTTTKDTGYEAVGVDLIRTATSLTSRPVVAIGGITLVNAEQAIRAGATMVAVIGDLLSGGDPSRRVRAYAERLGGA